jgi:hypothetical protein
MSKTKFFISLVLALSVLAGQVGYALAAPASQESDVFTGTVKSITLETDSNTGITTVIVEMKGADQTKQTFRLSQKTAITVGLVALDGDGNLIINKLALGKPFEIDLAKVIPDEQVNRNPVGDALATFFSDVPGMDYETIMAAHDKGAGFSVIAQTLWLNKQLEGNSKVFDKLLTAWETGDYSDFTVDGATPKSWAQLRKAILDGKKVDKPDNAAANQNTGNNKDKKKDKNKGNSGNNEDKGKGNNK